ncbi:MAG: hypothetical protein ACYTF0_08370, partial [Planctomycetota bacterium]
MGTTYRIDDEQRMIWVEHTGPAHIDDALHLIWHLNIRADKVRGYVEVFDLTRTVDFRVSAA